MYVWKRERESERTWEPPVDVPHFYHQCLTSVAPAWPPRNESITLNNVNVSPSQHKTNNHCSLPRATSAWRQPSQPPGAASTFFASLFRPRQRGLFIKSALACECLQLNYILSKEAAVFSIRTRTQFTFTFILISMILIPCFCECFLAYLSFSVIREWYT